MIVHDKFICIAFFWQKNHQGEFIQTRPPVRYHSNNLVSFYWFLCRSHSGFYYFNVYDHKTKQYLRRYYKSTPPHSRLIYSNY